jgi:glucose/arabinose dehydrogenase
MNISRPFAWGLLVVVCAGAAFAQQPDPLTDFEITGHVYEPQPIAPTDERLQQVTLPSGFHIHRYAEGLYNPRILATSDDGTVYVTQRTPGNLVMLRDLDDDGVVDAQRVVVRLRDVHGIAIRANTVCLVTVHSVYAADLNPDGSVGELETVTAFVSVCAGRNTTARGDGRRSGRHEPAPVRALARGVPGQDAPAPA